MITYCLPPLLKYECFPLTHTLPNAHVNAFFPGSQLGGLFLAITAVALTFHILGLMERMDRNYGAAHEDFKRAYMHWKCNYRRTSCLTRGVTDLIIVTFQL